MTVFNTSYCSIDEAWGDLTTKSKRSKKTYPKDPICELYENKVNTGYQDADLVKFANEYYDKMDKSRYQRNTMQQPKVFADGNDREPPNKTVTIKNDQKRYDVAQERRNIDKFLFEKQFEMSLPPMYDTNGDSCSLFRKDDDFLDWQPKYSITYGEHRNNRRNSVDNDDVEYVCQERRVTKDERQEDKKVTENKKRCQAPTYTEYDAYQEMPFDDEAFRTLTRKSEQNISVLDLVLYIISGVILIFLMEQFVRIGINMQM